MASTFWNKFNPQLEHSSYAFLLFFQYRAIIIYLYWILLLLLFFCFIESLRLHFSNRKVESNCYTKLQLNLLRKAFHLLIFFIIVIPIKYYDDISAFYLVRNCSLGVLILFVMMELIRFWYPFSKVSIYLTKYMSKFMDHDNSGHHQKEHRMMKPILDHIFLMGGVTIPLLMSSPNSLESLSGCISLGLGDSAAALGGCFCGMYRMPGTNGKTMGGVLSCIIILLFSSALLSNHEISHWESFVLASVTSIIELYSPINDNVILPLAYWIVLKKLIKCN